MTITRVTPSGNVLTLEGASATRVARPYQVAADLVMERLLALTGGKYHHLADAIEQMLTEGSLKVEVINT